MLLLDSRARRNNLGNKGLKVGQQKIEVGFYLHTTGVGRREERRESPHPVLEHLVQAEKFSSRIFNWKHQFRSSTIQKDQNHNE